ncbi:MAG: GNAT family N-acetyltransferase [Acidimicrobiia bacterium]
MQLDLAFVDETTLDNAERKAIGSLLPERWEQYYPGTWERAWSQRAPTYRLVGSVGGVVVANQSIFDVTVDVPAFGLGDLAVHPDYQHSGIARALVQVTVADLRERTDALILTSSGTEHVRALFFALGFQIVPEAALDFVVPPGDANQFDWLSSPPIASDIPLRVLAPC